MKRTTVGPAVQTVGRLVSARGKPLTDSRDALRRLAGQLADLPDDAFAEKYRLSVEMDRLRAGLPPTHKDDGRSLRDIEIELRSLRSQFAQLMKASAIAITPMSDGAGGSGDAAHVELRSKMLRTGDWMRVRIGELEAAITRLSGS
jgi:hypothetical protein